jgi:predicted TPR repeat methyltransferase
MECQDYKLQFPKAGDKLDQNEEWFTVITENGSRKVVLHDYGRVYEIPGLYEDVVYKRLKCRSPEVVCQTLKKVMDGEEVPMKALDFGAGNGIVAEYLREAFDCEALVGLDIIPEAKEAAERDRPRLYNDYYVMDLSRMTMEKSWSLKKWGFNTLVTVAALGYGDIPTQAFVNAFNLIERGGWVGFNIKDRFFSKEDDTGYYDTLEAMMGDSLEVLENFRYCHRLSMAGEPLHYHVIVGRKLKNVPSH